MAVDNMIKGRYICTSVIIVVISAIVIGVCFSIYDLPRAWNLFFSDSPDTPSYAYATLIIFRFTLYFLPGIMSSIFLYAKTKNIKVSAINSFSYQFIVYGFVAAVFKIFAIERYLEYQIFDMLDSFVLVIGLALSTVFKINLVKIYSE